MKIAKYSLNLFTLLLLVSTLSLISCVDKSQPQSTSPSNTLIDEALLLFKKTKNITDNNLSQLQNMEQVLLVLKKAEALDPSSARLYYNWSIVLYELKRYSQSYEKLNKAEQLDPTIINKNFKKLLLRKLMR